MVASQECPRDASSTLSDIPMRDRLRAVECPSDIIDTAGGWTTTGVGQRYGTWTAVGCQSLGVDGPTLVDQDVENTSRPQAVLILFEPFISFSSAFMIEHDLVSFLILKREIVIPQKVKFEDVARTFHLSIARRRCSW